MEQKTDLIKIDEKILCWKKFLKRMPVVVIVLVLLSVILAYIIESQGFSRNGEGVAWGTVVLSWVFLAILGIIVAILLIIALVKISNLKKKKKQLNGDSVA